MYVCDRAAGEHSRILMYQVPALYDGMPAVMMPNPVTSVGQYLYQLILDTRMHGLWLQYRFGDSVLLDLDSHEEIVHLDSGSDGAIEIDAAGNLFMAEKDFWSEGAGVYRYDAPEYAPPVKVLSGELTASADTMGQSFGATVFGDQLIVADHGRVLIYNDYHTLSSGRAADDVYGQEGFDEFDYNPYWFPTADARGRLWMMHAFFGKIGRAHV